MNTGHTRYFSVMPLEHAHALVELCGFKKAPQKQALLMYAAEGLDLDTIAARTGIEKPNLLKQMRRAAKVRATARRSCGLDPAA